MVLTHNCTKLSKSRTNWAIVTWWLENCCCSLTSKIKAAGRPWQAQTKPDRSWSLTELVQNLWHPKSNSYVCYHENSKYWAVQSLGAWQPTNVVVHPREAASPRHSTSQRERVSFRLLFAVTSFLFGSNLLLFLSSDSWTYPWPKRPNWWLEYFLPTLKKVSLV